MNGLVLMLVLGGVLLALLLLALLRGVPRSEAAPASYGRLAQVVALPGLSFASPERLFDPADYRTLRKSSLPAHVAGAVADERRRLALLWLRLLRDDVQTLWRFRRLLAVHGVSAGPADEFRVALSGFAAVTAINCLRVAVALAGPFAVAQFCQAGRSRVEAIWHVSAALFGRVPAGQLAEFEQRWAATTAATPFVFVR